jgi:hypothetical protein
MQKREEAMAKHITHAFGAPLQVISVSHILNIQKILTALCYMRR